MVGVMSDSTKTFRLSQLGVDPTSANAGGCGCGCSGHGDAQAEVVEATDATEAAAATEVTAAPQEYAVNGMTCGHCANAVTQELSALQGVESVTVDLVAGGTSTVHVIGRSLSTDEVAAALDEAGDYTLA